MPVAQACLTPYNRHVRDHREAGPRVGPEEVELVPGRRHVEVDPAAREGDAERDRIRRAAVVQSEHEVRGFVEEGPAPGLIQDLSRPGAWAS